MVGGDPDPDYERLLAEELRRAGGPVVRRVLIEATLDAAGLAAAERARKEDGGELHHQKQAGLALSALGKRSTALRLGQGRWVHADHATAAQRADHAAWLQDRLAHRRTTASGDRPARNDLRLAEQRGATAGPSVAPAPEPAPTAAPSRPHRATADPGSSPGNVGSTQVGATPDGLEGVDPSATFPAQPVDVTARWNDQPRWSQLVAYIEAAEDVRRVSPAEPKDVAVHGAPGVRPEDVLVGGPDRNVPVPSELLRFCAQASRTRSGGRATTAVLLGWPAVTTHGRRLPTRLPLLVVEVVPDPASGSLRVRSEGPMLHQTLLSCLDRETADSADACFGATPVGTADDLVRLVGRLGEILGAHRAPETGRQGSRAPTVVDEVLAVRFPDDIARRRLRSELQQLRDRQDWAGTAARHFVRPLVDRGVEHDGDATAGGREPESRTPVLVPDGLRLNGHQEDAVVSVLHHDLTVIEGPPGTGKSQVVAVVAANALRAGQSVLIASQNNAAVKAAVERATGDGRTALAVQTGNRGAVEELRATAETLGIHLEPASITSEQRDRALEVAQAHRDRVTGQLEERARLHRQAEQRRDELRSHHGTIWDAPEGLPVEIATRARRFAAAAPVWQWAHRRRLIRDALERKPDLAAGDIDAWLACEKAFVDATLALADLPPYDGDGDRAALRAADDDWQRASDEAITTALRRARFRAHDALLALKQADMSPKSMHRAIGEVRQALPVWATTALSVGGSFPLQAGIFDLLVVDEASACDIATILPLAYRARRIAVVGDTNQLSPVVPLDRPTVDRIARTAGTTAARTRELHLSVDEDSAYTALAARSTADQRLLLAEHYRCHPQIASFLNTAFYGGRLEIVSPLGLDHRLRGLHWVEVAGRCRRGPGGSWTNDAEAEAVVEWLAKHVDDLGLADADGGDSVGVVTLFQAQAQAIAARLKTRFGGDIADRVTVATAHTFQGSERDVMLFATTVADGVADRTARWVDSEPRLVNVAVSRARRALVAFGHEPSVRRHRVGSLLTLAELSRPGTNATTRRDADGGSFASEAERRLFRALRAAGLSVEHHVEVEWCELDFRVWNDDPSLLLNVECDGSQHLDPGGRQRRRDLDRDARLVQAGWRVMRFPAWRCFDDADAVAGEVARFVAELGASRRTPGGDGHRAG